MNNEKVWLITGASQGLGLEMVKYLLAQHQIVIATTRNKDKFDSSVRDNHRLEIVNLDLNSDHQVNDTIGRIADKYGSIDVLINNAGYGIVGAIEECSSEEIENVIAINVLATLRMIRSVLPYMRKRHSGHIINLSSMAGLLSSPGWGIYNTTKYAVEGFTEALYHEVKDLGIKVSMLEPGAFRTHFLAGSLVSAEQVIPDYDATAGNTKRRLAGNDGKQPNDPRKAAIAVYDLVQMDDPPLRLLLGKDAYTNAKKKIALLEADFERMKNVTFEVGY